MMIPNFVPSRYVALCGVVEMSTCPPITSFAFTVSRWDCRSTNRLVGASYAFLKCPKCTQNILSVCQKPYHRRRELQVPFAMFGALYDPTRYAVDLDTSDTADIQIDRPSSIYQQTLSKTA